MTAPRVAFRSFAIGLLLVSILGAPVALADSSDPGGTFTDDDGNVHEGGIEAIAMAAITLGCNPPGNYLYCPADAVTRGEMAAFLSRALGLPVSANDHFNDDEGSVFEGAINRVADAGITQGCNPPANDNYCPARTLSRGEMAGFLARAFNIPPSTSNRFVDDDGHLFEGAINRIADAGFTVGCNPPTNDRYCPDDQITRDQMATLLTRALGLTSMKPPPPDLRLVLAVWHGDTVRATVGGVSNPFRLIGIDAPWAHLLCGMEARAVLDALIDDRIVRLDTDVTDIDSFGERLRYVFLTDGTFVNALMVASGWARAVDVPPDSKYARLFASLEAEAMAAERGQWGANCAPPTG